MTMLKRAATTTVAAALLMTQAGIALAASEGPIKVSSGDLVRGTHAVVVGAFNVGFIFKSVDNTKAAGGLMGAFGGATRTQSELQGVTPAMMQAITDAAYADFKTQLTAHGFAVADGAPMYASSQFARVKPVASPYAGSVALEKKSTGKVDFYKPSALPGLVMLPGDITASGFSSMGMVMSAGNTAYGMSEYAKATGQAVVDVVYLVDFSNTRRPGAFSFGGLTVTSGMSIVADYSKMNVVTTSGKIAALTLKEPIIVEGDFATMQDATKDKTVQSAMNVLGGLAALGGMGGMKFGKSRTYAFTVKPGVYEGGVEKAASIANGRLIDQLTALR